MDCTESLNVIKFTIISLNSWILSTRSKMSREEGFLWWIQASKWDPSETIQRSSDYIDNGMGRVVRFPVSNQRGYLATPFWMMIFPEWRWPKGGKPRSCRNSNASRIWRPNRWTWSSGNPSERCRYFWLQSSCHRLCNFNRIQMSAPLTEILRSDRLALNSPAFCWWYAASFHLPQLFIPPPLGAISWFHSTLLRVRSQLNVSRQTPSKLLSIDLIHRLLRVA